MSEHVPDAVAMLLEQGRIRKIDPADEEIIGFWNKGSSNIEAASMLPGSKVESVLTLGHQAALQLATAILLAAGYRVAKRGHHYFTFATLAELEVPPASAHAAELNRFRELRNAAQYEGEPIDDPDLVAEYRALLDEFSRDARKALLSLRPDLADHLVRQETGEPPA